jgi:hypothetical protein
MLRRWSGAVRPNSREPQQLERGRTLYFELSPELFLWRVDGGHCAHDVQAKLDRLVNKTGRPPDEPLEDAMTGYDAGLTETRQMLNSLYDDVKSGKVKLVPGDEVVVYSSAATSKMWRMKQR